MPYDYPPSRYILQFGPLQENSHYYCEGIAFFNIRGFTKLKCEFEVAYTQECKVIAACYFPDYRSLMRGVRGRWYEECYKIIGRAKRSRLNIIFERDMEVKVTNVHLGVLPAPLSYSILFSGSCYTVFTKSSHTDATHPQRKGFHVTGLDFSLSFNDPEAVSKGVAFNVGNQENAPIKLFPMFTNQTPEYLNQATGYLTIKEELIPNKWTDIGTADLWCALASLALGRDVQWVAYSSTSTQGTAMTWVTKNVRGRSKFHALIIDDLVLGEEWEKLKRFISTNMNGIIENQIRNNELSEYIHLIRTYVDYSAIIGISKESRTRLLATLTEELLYLWEKFSKSTASRIITRRERRKIDELIADTLHREIDTILIESSQNREAIIQKIIKIIQNNMRPDFRERLTFFFESHQQLPTNYELAKRIKAFVDTRNAIAHQGVFAWANDETSKKKLQKLCPKPEHQTRHEYENVIMFIPIMCLCIFSYDGPYYDMLYGEQKWWVSQMPPPPPSGTIPPVTDTQT